MTTATAQIGATPQSAVHYGSISRGRQAHAVLVLFLPDPVRHLLPDAAGLHVHHLAQDERGDRRGHQSVVGLPPDLAELHRPADPGVSF